MRHVACGDRPFIHTHTHATLSNYLFSPFASPVRVPTLCVLHIARNMSGRPQSSPSLPECAGPVLFTTKPRKPKLLHKLHLQSSGPSVSMEIPTVKGVSFPEMNLNPHLWNYTNDPKMTSSQEPKQYQTGICKDGAQSPDPLPPRLLLPPRLPYASVLRR